MFDLIRNRIVPLLRLPPEPTAPAGAPGSVRVFRAGRNFYKITLLRWMLAQAMAAAGIAFSVGFLVRFEREVALIVEETPADDDERVYEARPHDKHDKIPRDLAEKVAPNAHWIIPLAGAIEALGIASFLIQLVVTFIVLRLEYEMRWYMVTDRSLRIRAGVWNVQESTMSFANLQQVELSQGPLQRLLGIADVRVQSAGGGATTGDKKHQDDSLHTGVFHGVTNAAEIRDLIQARLHDFRETGLGDPDDTAAAASSGTVPVASEGSSRELQAAMSALLTEARSLRASVQ